MVIGDGVRKMAGWSEPVTLNSPIVQVRCLQKSSRPQRLRVRLRKMKMMYKDGTEGKSSERLDAILHGACVSMSHVLARGIASNLPAAYGAGVLSAT